MTKQELIDQNQNLIAELKLSRSREGSHNVITNCNITADENKQSLAIAKAVEAGMVALQKIGESNSVGILIEGNK